MQKMFKKHDDLKTIYMYIQRMDDLDISQGLIYGTEKPPNFTKDFSNRLVWKTGAENRRQNNYGIDLRRRFLQRVVWVLGTITYSNSNKSNTKPSVTPQSQLTW